MASEVEATVVELHGEVDVDGVELLRDCLRDCVDLNADILVDLADVTLIDCASLGALLESRQLADRRGHRLCLVAPSPAVRRILSGAMLDTAFPQYPDRRHAVSCLSGGAAGQV
ncbi:STAS domain-containing protein [Nucisporomicrobium flavum]|uniref:STAS domain-containing protein n=1 Tax=Nucisporomicrobium flavum TaxID=2785915 RepID=UPI0018F46D0C|nr:STAS domain-containing protein [Nucisporomicrobium flavum]